MLGLAAGDSAGGLWELGYTAITEQATVIAYQLIEHGGLEVDSLVGAIRELDGFGEDEPVFRMESPELRARVKPARSRDAGNTMLSKEFAGGILIMTGANSAVGLRSTPARYIFLDEVDAYPASADEEGDPVTLAEARSLTFAHRRKVFLVSTPTIRGLSRIEREFETSDQRRYFVPCPHCGEHQTLELANLRFVARAITPPGRPRPPHRPRAVGS